MSDAKKILPCPHCGSIESVYIRHKTDMFGTPVMYAIACLKCKFSSNSTTSEDDAISAWNEQVNNGKLIKMKKFDENFWWNRKVFGEDDFVEMAKNLLKI